MVPLEEEMVAFLVSIFAGCLAALCFDVYRTLARYLRLKRLGLGIGDILFWMVLAGIVFFLLLLSNDGQIRGLMLVGLVLGAGIYIRVLGEQSTQIIDGIFKLIIKTFALIRKILVWIWVCLTAPVRLVFRVIAYPFGLFALVWRRVTGPGRRCVARVVPSGLKRSAKKWASPVVSLKSFLNRKKG